MVKKSAKSGKAKSKGGVIFAQRKQDNSKFRMLGDWSEGPFQQTSPPTIPVTQQFELGKFPVGEI